MLQYAIKPRLVVPALVKGLVNMDNLRLAESVKMGNHGIQLVNHIFLLIDRKGSTLNTDCIRPGRKNARQDMQDVPRVARRAATLHYRGQDVGLGKG